MFEKENWKEKIKGLETWEFLPTYSEKEILDFIEKLIDDEEKDVIGGGGIKSIFEKKEIRLLIALVEAQKESINLLRGFRAPNKEEQDENAYYNRLMEKLNKLYK